ncbi:MAG: TIGR02679 family protein [Actinomycetota bacterium]
MNSAADSELGELIASPGLQRLFQRARIKLEREGLESNGTVSLAEPTHEERSACARTLGVPPSGAKVLRVSLAQLDRSLRASRHAKSLHEVLELQGGPLLDRRAAAELEARALEQMWSEASAHPAVEGTPELRSWLERLRATGLLKRVAPDEERAALRRALSTLGALPADGVGLGLLATRVSGEAHALDNGRPLATIVQHALAFLRGEQLPSGAAGRRRLWATFGVVCDELSCDVLTLGLAPRGRHRAARSLRGLATHGEPLRLTLRQLVRSDLSFAAKRVFVCENPVVVAAAADGLGAGCPVLLCTDGIPNTAAMTLARSLAAGGAEICFHADFDWGGIRIGNVLVKRLGAVQWRFMSPDYERALSRVSRPADLAGAPLKAAWDEALHLAMSRAAAAIYEEQALESLMDDLSSARTRR